MNLAETLKGAIDRHEFFMSYQPIFDLNTRNMISMEALIRWNHPILGLISPEVFIPLAEKTGLINLIGTWAIKTISAQSREWGLADHRDITISVNVSPLQLLQPNFPQFIKHTLEEHLLSPEQLVIEITETTMLPPLTVTECVITDTSLAPRLTPAQIALNQIHDMGINIVIDDFGTGYSSFMYLSRLPIKAFKIDKSFIHGINNNSHDAIILTSLINLGKRLGLDVIVEGIEAEEQIQFLLENECPFGQGYYLCKPLSVFEMATFLKNREKPI